MSNLANRFIDVVFNLSNHRYDAAITLLSTLIDRTAKDTYQIKEVGVRFRKLIDDNADFILWYSTEGALQFSSVIIGDKTIGTVFYKIIRNAEIHEAELRDIEFVTTGVLISADTIPIQINVSFIYGIFFILCYLPVNRNHVPKGIWLKYNAREISLDEIIGVGKDMALNRIRISFFGD